MALAIPSSYCALDSKGVARVLGSYSEPGVVDRDLLWQFFGLLQVHREDPRKLDTNISAR